MPGRAPGKLSAAAAALYKRKEAAPANAFLAALAARDDDKDIEVWPENWAAWTMFMRVQTQWNVGMNGATGLRYEAIYPLLDREAKTRDEWEDLFDDIQVIERAALIQMGDNRSDE